MSLLLGRNDLHPFTAMDVPWLLAQRALTRPEHPFIVWAPFDGPAQTFGYGEFQHRVERVAGGLWQRGVRRGERVLIHLDNCPEALLAWYACARIGAVAVTTNARAAGDELAYYAEHSEAVAGITQPRFAELVAANCPGLRWLAVTASDNGDAPTHVPERQMLFDALDADAPPRQAPDPLAPCSVQYTSGTTSRPKAVLWTHANALWGARINALHEDLRAERRPPGAPAAVPHQRAGLFRAGLPVGGRHGGGGATLLGQPLLARVAGARLHLDFGGAVLRQGTDGA